MFQGSMVALVTPMLKDGSVDWPVLDKLVEMHVDAGTDAIIAVGTTGESPTLPEPEHCQVIKRVVDVVNKRLPVIAGTGANATREAIELSTFAMEAGADATLLVCPYYNKPPQQGLIAHYQAIAREVALPHILYNVPGRTAVDMSVDTIATLAKVPNIVGVKEASGSIDRIAAIHQACGDSIEIYSGDDDIALQTIKAGARGVISVTANVAPRRMHEIFAAALAGDFAKAEALNEPLTLLHQNLFLQANPIPVKWALHMMGLMDTGIRLPLLPLEESFHDALKQAMIQAQLL